MHTSSIPTKVTAVFGCFLYGPNQSSLLVSIQIMNAYFILPRFDLKYRMLRTCSTASTELYFLDIIESYTNLESSCFKHEIIFSGIFCKVTFDTLLEIHSRGFPGFCRTLSVQSISDFKMGRKICQKTTKSQTP